MTRLDPVILSSGDEIIPRMPDDWWPDHIEVISRCKIGKKQLAISFMVMGDVTREQTPMVMSDSLENARFALWQAMHDKASPTSS